MVNGENPHQGARRVVFVYFLGCLLAGGCGSGTGREVPDGGKDANPGSAGAAGSGGAAGMNDTGGVGGREATGGATATGGTGQPGGSSGAGGAAGAGGAGGVAGRGGDGGGGTAGDGGSGVGGAGGTAVVGGTGGGAGAGGAGGSTVYRPCPTDGSPCKILPFGDSITLGMESSDDAGYRSQLFKLIVAAGQKVTFTGSLANGPTQVSGQSFPRMHEGHSGWTIDPGYSQYASTYGGISSLVPSPALSGKPNIILLHIGANDLFGKDPAGMATRLDALVEKIAQNAPSALIVLAQITPVGATNNGHTQAQVDAANAAQMTYNRAIPTIIQSHLAKGQHITGVDMSKMPLTDLTTASVHPNNQGYAYMAGIWYAALKDLLPGAK